MPNAHILFEEAGSFKAGTILQDAGQSLQVETSSGKRTKVKQASVMLRFDAPGPGDLMARAQHTADAIDADFLWECAPQDEFDFVDLAAEYFGAGRSPEQTAGLLLKLHSLPVYFYRKGKGRYRPAQPETLRAALAAIERKRFQEAEIARLADALVAGELPEAIASAAVDCLVAKDKQSIAYRAFDLACQRASLSPERLLLKVGAFPDPKAIHEARFRHAHFPAGIGFAAGAATAPVVDGFDALPQAEVRAFSIDDESTTEIDDCLSVTPIEDGLLRFGIHIAAPALAIGADDALDRLARDRMTTVYSPGEKITMLPDAVVQAFSLDEGQTRAALSLYVDVDPGDWQVKRHFSRLDRIRVETNLRHNRLDALIEESALQDGTLAGVPHAQELIRLWHLMLALSAERDRVRGRPEARFRVDFSFKVDGDRVDIQRRRRDAPLDRIVAEMMILANRLWGAMLADHGVAGLYRSQSMGKVKMGTHPQEHQGLGVAQYAWCTSPLRRYVDLVNQMQLIAVLTGRTPPFAANDASLFGILSGFDARYSAVSDFQQTMERYWCLRWVRQHEVRRFDATAVREDTVRLTDAPLYFGVPGCPPLVPGQRLLVDILAVDELDLGVQARFVRMGAETDEAEGLDAVAASPDAGAAGA